MNENINVHDNYPSSEQSIEVPAIKVMPLKRICVTLGELPTAYIETMSYYEMLLWFIAYLRDNIIPAVNGNAEATQEVQEVVMNLQQYINDFKDSIDQDVEDLETYINNYFDNLDVQDEINNKLDDMLEDGVLEQIIEQFLQLTSLICFDNVADMKASTNLANGSYAKTLGFYNKNDGGGAIYKIRYITNDDVVNEMSIIALNDEENNLIAELTNKTNINTMMFGCKNDKSEDVSTRLQTAINYIKNNSTDNALSFIEGDYLLNSEIYIPSNFIILGNFANLYGNFNGYVLGCNVTSNNSTWEVAYSRYSCTIKNLGFHANTNDLTINGIKLGCSCDFEDLYFDKFTMAISQVTQYVDSKTFKNIIVNDPKGNYDVDLWLGDGVMIQECTAVKFKIVDNMGCNVSSCNNCSFYIAGCSGVLLTNLHNEFNRKCYIENSVVSFKDCNIWKSPDEDENFEIKTSGTICSVSLENITFWIRKTAVFNELKKDINIDNGSILYIKNVSRGQERVSGVGTIRTHIRINSLAPIVANEYIYKNGNVSALEKACPYNCNYYITSLSKVTDSTLHGNFSSSDGTLYYRGTLYLDTTRLIRYPSQYGVSEKSVTITDNNTLVNIVLSATDTPPNTYLRLYRGSVSDTYTHYTDVPIKDGFLNLYDDKNFICKNFSQWIEGSQTYNQGIIGYNYKEINNLTTKNVQILASSTPTYGTWTKGDIIINSNPTAGGNYGWICTANGTPGTWKAISTIAS